MQQTGTSRQQGGEEGGDGDDMFPGGRMEGVGEDEGGRPEVEDDEEDVSYNDEDQVGGWIFF